MTKSKFMRVAAILMAAVLLTTCAISGTFAKYVTSGNATDSARVAKWGVTVTGTSDSAFAETYAKDDSTTSFENTVAATEKVVAPGTGGTLTAFTIAGEPEVAVKVTYESQVTLSDWGSYCPIAITVGDTEYKQGDNDVATFAATVKAAIDAYSDEYAAGTDLSTATAPAISWAWAFDDGTTSTDAKDTALGNLATAPSISIITVCTVTQID